MSNTSYIRNRLSRWMLLSLLACVLAACGGGGGGTSEPVNLQEQYANAVADARIASSEKMVRTLTPINGQNAALVWENNVVGSRLLVATWIDGAGKYYICSSPSGCIGNTSCLEGGECPAYKYDTWVSVVPELQVFFHTVPATPLRVAQLLGLPPEAAVAGGPKEYQYILELWVSPIDIFRPCPDTEVSDTVCELDFPMDTFRTDNLTNMVRVTSGPDYGKFMAYKDWFTYQKSYDYTMGSNPYPWTRLGYTYDWGSNNHVGLSEFVLHGRKVDGSTISVGIKSVKTTAAYFAK